MQSLADWVRNLSGANIPVLAKTIGDLARLQANEDSVTARDLSQIVLRDPLMTLKILRFSQSRLTHRQPTEVTTVEHAIMMHGLTSFFREMRNLKAIEDQMGAHPRALSGALRVISRACHAASYARSFSALRYDMETDEVVTSALLHDLAELLLWSADASSALQIEQMLHHHQGLRSASAQRACLGFQLADLQLALAREWKLPRLLQSLMDDQHANHPRALTVTLSVALARHSANGWMDPALPSDYAAIQKLVNLPLENVMRWVRLSALQVARNWTYPGVRPAAGWLPMLPGEWPEEEEGRSTEEPAGLMVRVLNQLAQPPPQLTEISTLCALAFYGFSSALCLRRLWFGRLDDTGNKVQAWQTLMLDPGLLPGDLMFELGSPHLFARLMDKVQGVWLGDTQRAKLAPLLPHGLRTKLATCDFFAMSVRLKGHPFGLIYADGGVDRPQLNERDYGAFKSLCAAFNQALERSSA